MPKTPSIGLDQNKKETFRDRYWGRVPQFLIYMPESYLCEANPEYIELMNLYLDNDAKENLRDVLSKELFAELEKIMLNILCPCLLTGKERALVNAFYGNDPCARPNHMLDCSGTVCCNEIISCKSETICT